MENKIEKIKLVLNIVCPIIQLLCVIGVSICKNKTIDFCIIGFQVVLLCVQYLLPMCMKKILKIK